MPAAARKPSHHPKRSHSPGKGDATDETTSVSGFVVSTPVDHESAVNTGLPIALLVVLQLWAVFGSSHHPVTMPADNAVFSAAIVQMIQDSQTDFSPTWPYPSRVDFTTAQQSLMSVISTFKLKSNIYNSIPNFNYQDSCPVETFCQEAFHWPQNETCSTKKGRYDKFVSNCWGGEILYVCGCVRVVVCACAFLYLIFLHTLAGTEKCVLDADQAVTNQAELDALILPLAKCLPPAPALELREEKLFKNISLTEANTWLASINAWTADSHNLSAAMDVVQNRMFLWMTNR